MKTVVVLGASDKPDRYSNRAFHLLLEKGYRVIPVNPSLERLSDVTVEKSLSDVSKNPDVLTVYVSPERSSLLADEILALHPKSVIFNPGAENPSLSGKLRDAGIWTLEACTVVLLTTGRFDIEIATEEVKRKTETNQ